MSPEPVNIDHAMMREVAHEVKTLREMNAEMAAALARAGIALLNCSNVSSELFEEIESLMIKAEKLKWRRN